MRTDLRPHRVRKENSNDVHSTNLFGNHIEYEQNSTFVPDHVTRVAAAAAAASAAVITHNKDNTICYLRHRVQALPRTDDGAHSNLASLHCTVDATKLVECVSPTDVCFNGRKSREALTKKRSETFLT
ncbi:hypothetical protein EVAR_75240_1 [Eumeta japonica]|uniref:Uncharacterized protein n=1 Tax=Eumeta variegata TaxID=151549 RepID=A0A4C1V9R8_EUMVA|nr:hypothetical protein EVAR_75240_1 [Eumeta japonica]